MGVQPPFAELWIAVTWGPLIEEVVFRGYLFSFLESGGSTMRLHTKEELLFGLRLRHSGRSDKQRK